MPDKPIWVVIRLGLPCSPGCSALPESARRILRVRSPPPPRAAIEGVLNPAASRQIPMARWST